MVVIQRTDEKVIMLIQIRISKYIVIHFTIIAIIMKIAMNFFTCFNWTLMQSFFGSEPLKVNLIKNASCSNVRNDKKLNARTEWILFWSKFLKTHEVKFVVTRKTRTIAYNNISLEKVSCLRRMENKKT